MAEQVRRSCVAMSKARKTLPIISTLSLFFALPGYDCPPRVVSLAACCPAWNDWRETGGKKKDMVPILCSLHRIERRHNGLRYFLAPSFLHLIAETSRSTAHQLARRPKAAVMDSICRFSTAQGRFATLNETTRLTPFCSVS